MRRLAVGIVLPLLLVTASCGGDDTPEVEKATPGTIADVSVTGDFESKPVVKFKAPMSFEKSESKTLIEGPGEGDQVAPTSEVTLNYLGINASDGVPFITTWTDEGVQPATFKISQVFKGLTSGLVGAHAGDQVLLTLASADAFDRVGNSDQTVRPGDSIVMVVDVIAVDNPKVVPPEQLPTLDTDKDGNPSGFTPKKDTPDSVGLLGSDVVTKGTGAVVKADDTVQVRYLGQVYPDGAVFDENYTAKGPLSTPLSAFPGWTESLTGQTVGSRVILTVPSELAYGATGDGGDVPPNADLIFVVDIVGVVVPTAIPDDQVPTLQLDKDGVPTGFKAKADSPADVTKLGVDVVKEGKGEVVKADATVSALYLGQIYPDGTVFDENFSDGTPTEFSLDQVIKGWTNGLVGLKVGTRVILTIPSELGYGAQGSGQDIPPDSDLIFVIDIKAVK